MGLRCLKIAVVYLVLGAGLGVHMGATQAFAMAPVHAHMLLLGWVSLALVGIVYHLYPAAGTTKLAAIHFWAHNLLLPVLLALLAMFLSGSTAAGPALGVVSVAMLAALAVFAVNVFLNARPG